MKSSIYKSLLALAAPLLLAACSSDGNEPNQPQGEEVQGFEINVYNPQLSTRAGTAGSELYISDLHVLVYDVTNPNNDGKPVKVVDMGAQNLDYTTYTQQRLELPVGNYRIYAIANIPIANIAFKGASDTETTEYRSWTDIVEDKLAKAEITGMNPIELASATGGNTTILKTGLPMTCNNAAVLYQKKGETTTTKVGSSSVPVVNKQTTRVYVNMMYAVAKVRYTVLNQAISTLKMDQTTANRVKIINAANKVGAISHLSSLSSDDLIASSSCYNGGQYYKCPKYNETNGYLIKTVDGNDVDDTSDISDFPDTDKISPSSTTTSWAYQGNIYIPERLFTADEKDAEGFAPTQLQLGFTESALTEKAKYSFGDQEVTITDPMNGAASVKHYGVVRGVFYDILAYTSSKQVTLKVRVKPWEYHRLEQDL